MSNERMAESMETTSRPRKRRIGLVMEDDDLSWSFQPETKRICTSGDNTSPEDDVVCNIVVKQMPPEKVGEIIQTTSDEFQCQILGCSKYVNSIAEFETHYNTVHRNVCGVCKKSLPSAYLLDIHLLEWHDSLFELMSERQNMYQCLLEICPDSFRNAHDRRRHMVQVHKYPSNFKFDKPRKKDRNAHDDKAGAKKSPSLAKSEDTKTGLAMDTGAPVEASAALDAAPGVTTGNTQPAGATHRQYRMPRQICFGRGAPRGFEHTKHKRPPKKQGGKKKEEKQKLQETPAPEAVRHAEEMEQESVMEMEEMQ
ncbi:PREDICTED: zinc finger protein 511-like [Branchiostoma belcheri]|uniref:Zinc finger protein 511-like n=1 Tax=Branchiostoma belcheri TaxID=7741 RepID=A0A6P4YEC6_BRABE|nr:PREDICTED: zinc finger protein 511-like [Branchiostoma belcheri]XP_019627555.1 PREDICTED: zinc finger protein 511-like [Branchiostoma belcheri]